MQDNLLDFMKNININSQEAQQTPYEVNQKAYWDKL